MHRSCSDEFLKQNNQQLQQQLSVLQVGISVFWENCTDSFFQRIACNFLLLTTYVMQKLVEPFTHIFLANLR